MRGLAQSLGVLRRTFANPQLRNLQLAGIGSTLGIWAYGVAVAVYAYRADGAAAVGLLYLVRWSLAGAFAPWLAVVADRVSRRRVMLASDVARAALVGGMAAGAAAGIPSLVVYALAVVASVAGAAFQPAQSALLPALAASPEELTSANVALSTTSSVGMFAGPAVAGALLAFGSPELVFVVTAAAFVWSAACIARIPADVVAREGEPERIGAELLGGFRAIRTDPRLRLLVGLTGAQTLVAGALEVLVVVVALRLLRSGNEGVGWLNTALGVGGIGGAVAASALAARNRLARDLALGLALFGLPLALSAAWSRQAPLLVLFALAGLGSTIGDVAGITLVQRTASDDVLSRVFGVLESLIFATLAVGAGVAPALVHALGSHGALVAAGALLPASLVLVWPRLRAIDAAAAVPLDRLALLERIPIFAPLPRHVLERLASGARELEAPAGEAVVVQGAPGDLFYAIAAGRAQAEVDGEPVAELEAGDFFGEIALLRDVPRTATVRAIEALSLLTLERDTFLAAVTGHAPSRAAAERVAAARLPVGEPV